MTQFDQVAEILSACEKSMTVDEIISKTNLPRPTIRRIISQLKELGHVKRTSYKKRVGRYQWVKLA